jgi:hypothetical protein
MFHIAERCDQYISPLFGSNNSLYFDQNDIRLCASYSSRYNDHNYSRLYQSYNSLYYVQYNSHQSVLYCMKCEV